jgi:prepilin-type N-terminal cleavage/methylation domain-containing protein
MFTFSKSRQKGFSLLEVLVALGILLTIQAGIIYTLVGSIRTQTNLSKKLEADNLMELYRISLAKPEVCKNALSSLQVNVSKPENTKPYVFQEIYGLDDDGKPNATSLINFGQWKKLGLKDTSITNYKYLCSSTKELVANLLISFDTNNVQFYKNIPVYLKVSTLGKMESCSSLAQFISKDPCSSEGTWVNATGDQAKTCADAGLSLATDLGYGVCASGECRPQKGKNFNLISYKYGTWGSGGSGKCVGKIFGTYCYHDGQKHDNDGTDRTVAYLCK